MEFSKWITSGLKQPGKKAAELARLLGISPDKISKMKKGEREPKYGEIPIIEDDLGIKFSSRRTGRAAKPTARIPMPIPIIGIAEATAFRPASEFDAGDESSLATLLAPRSLLYPTARHFAMEVRGDSMNAAKDSPIPNGSFVLCIDIGSAGIIVESGRVYVVRRTVDGGQTYEWTVKRAYVSRGHTELRPESTNPKHQPILIEKNHGMDNGIEVQAIGLVYAVYNSLEE